MSQQPWAGVRASGSVQANTQPSAWVTFKDQADNVVPDNLGKWVGGAIDTIPGAKPFFDNYSKITDLENQAGSWAFSALPGGSPTLDWNKAAEVPVGQAAMANPFGVAAPLFAISNLAPEGSQLSMAVRYMAPFTDPNFDLNQDSYRKGAFEDSSYGSVSSAVLGGVFQWYTDPLVIAGKGLKVARQGMALGEKSTMGLTDRTVRTAADAEKVSKELDDYEKWITTSGMEGRKTAIGVAVHRTVKKNAAQMYYDPLATRSGNRALVADLLGESSNLSDSILITKAGLGDKAAIQQLAAKHADIADALARQEQLDFLAKRIVQTPQDLTKESFFDFSQAELDTMDAVLADLQAKDKFFSRALEADGTISKIGTRSVIGKEVRGALNDLRTEARYARGSASGARTERALTEKYADISVRVVQKNENNLLTGEREFNYVQPAWAETVFQRNPWVRPVRVWNWVAGERPSGWVKIKGANVQDSASEIFAGLDHSTTLRKMTDAQEFRMESMNKYLAAASPTERMQVVEQIERDAVSRIASKYEVPVERAQELYDTYARARASALKVAKDRGFLADLDGTLTKLRRDPVMTSQLEESIPMMDFNALEEVLARHKHVWRRTPGKVGDNIRLMSDALYSAWRSAVLLRGGYTIRNVVEGNLRSAAAIGFLPMFAEPMTVTKNFFYNQRQAATHGVNRAFDAVAGQSPKYIENRIQFLREQRNVAREQLAQTHAEARYVRQWDPEAATGLDAMTMDEFIQAAPERGTQLNIGDIDEAIASPSASLLPKRQRVEYGSLNDRLLAGEKLTPVEGIRLQHLRAKAARRRLRELQGTGMDVVYRGRSGELHLAENPSQIPDEILVPVGIKNRRGVPEGAVEAGVASRAAARTKATFLNTNTPDVWVLPKWRTNVRAATRNGQAVPGHVALEAGVRNPKPRGGYVSAMDDAARDEYRMWLEAERTADDKLSQALDDLDAAVARARKPKKRRRGDDAAYSGPYGDIARINASADSTYEATVTNMLDASAARANRLNSWKLVDPEDPTYFEELAHVVNYQMKYDELVSRVLAGKSHDELVAWVRSAEGRQYRRDMRLSYRDVEGQVSTIEGMVQRYIPDETLRARVLAEDLTPEQFAERLRGREDLSPIHGREVDQAMNLAGNLGRTYRGALRKIYTYLGTVPENVAVRHPFYNEMWKREFARLKTIAEGQGREIDEALLNQINKVSHQVALRETKKTLYTIERYSNPSVFLRWIFPFYPAWENTMKTWARLGWQDPSVVARASMIWNLPNNIAATGEVNPETGQVDVQPWRLRVVNSKGEPVPAGGGWDTDQFIVLPKPLGEALAKFASDQVPDIPKASMNVVLQGEVPWIPGVGPLVTLPASMAITANPDLETTIKEFMPGETGDLLYRQVVPFGRPTDDPLDTVLPATAQRAATLLGGDSNPEMIVQALSIWRDDYTRWQMNYDEAYNAWVKSGKVGPEPQPGDAPTAESALQRARDYYKARLFINATAPFSPRFRSPYAPVLDEFRAWTQQYGWEKANQMFDEKFGDTFAMFKKSLTEGATGMSPDQQAYSVYQNNKALWEDVVTTNPEMGQILTNPTSRGEFSPAVYAWQKGRPIAPGSAVQFRGIQSINDFALASKVSKGWSEYMNARSIVNDALAERGLESLQQRGAEDIADAWSLWLKKAQAENTDWYRDYVLREGEQKNYDIITTLTKAVNNQQFRSTSADPAFWNQVQEYLRGRDIVVQTLAERDAAGGSADINAKSNVDVLDAWNRYTLRLQSANTGFADFYARWLDRDNMKAVTVSGDDSSG